MDDPIAFWKVANGLALVLPAVIVPVGLIRLTTKRSAWAEPIWQRACIGFALLSILELLSLSIYFVPVMAEETRFEISFLGVPLSSPDQRGILCLAIALPCLLSLLFWLPKIRRSNLMATALAGVLLALYVANLLIPAPIDI